MHNKNKPNNNFDSIRTTAALLVMLSHAFQLSYGNRIWQTSPMPWPEPGLWLTQGQMSIGHICVLVFFMISGYLITMSQTRSTSSTQFMKNRVLRIFPALTVTLILTILIIGPLCSTLPTWQYLSNHRTWTYIQNITLFKTQSNLPEVFKNNPLPDITNGSLWTLKYEFLCYIVVCILGASKLLNKGTAVTLFASTAAHTLLTTKPSPPSIYFLMFFSVGMIVYFYRDKIKPTAPKAIACAAVLTTIATGIPQSQLKLLPIAVATLGGYTVFYIALRDRIALIDTSKYGDLSYGIYIYSFPIQQAVSQMVGSDCEWYTNLALALPPTLICAYVSWRCIEQPALLLRGDYREAPPAKAVA